MIHGDKQDGYTISSRHMWLPGIYATTRAARAAFRLDWATLQRLSDAVCAGERRRITSDDIRTAPQTSGPDSTPPAGAGPANRPEGQHQ